MPTPRLQRTLTIAGVLFVIAVMVTVVSFSVPLYRLFCAVTGAGGTTQRATSDTATQSAKLVTVYFNTDVAPGMPWTFEPVQRSVTLHLGEQAQAFFRATNNADRPIVGHATFNVTPDKSGIYFKKIQCFCFTEERLGPHQTVEMPVQFFVDPRLGTDPDTTDVDQITLSYTFFESKNPAGAQDLARLAASPPECGGWTRPVRRALRRLSRAGPRQGRPATWPSDRPHSRRRAGISLFSRAESQRHYLDAGHACVLARQPAGVRTRRADASAGNDRAGPGEHHRLFGDTIRAPPSARAPEPAF